LPYGYLFLALNDQELGMLRTSREIQQAAGLTEVELLSRSEVAELVPQLRTTDVVGGSFCPIDGFLDPLAAMRGFTHGAIDRGARMELQARVSAIEADQHGVAAVLTARGPVWTRTVINAAGAWAGEVARLAGVELPVSPLRRQLVAVDAECDLAPSAPMVLELDGGFHFRRGPWSSEHTPLLMGGIDPGEKPGFDTDFDDHWAAEVLRRATHRLPAMREPILNRQHSRAGLYEMTPDHHAILGEAPGLRGFFLANGFSGHGVMHAPATGRILADLVMRGVTKEFDIAPLSPERFARGSLVAERVMM
jgi:sarcosine oxidase subunit beta